MLSSIDGRPVTEHLKMIQTQLQKQILLQLSSFALGLNPGQEKREAGMN